MLTIKVSGNLGDYDLNLPTSLNEITEEYINDVTDHVKVDANYTLVGIIYRERLSTLILAATKNKKKSDVAVIPIFVKTGKTDSELINSLNVRDKLIISPSDIMMGYHISSPRNLLTINTIIDIVTSDPKAYNTLLGKKEECYFIEFKLVPNCNIHGAYKIPETSTFTNSYVIKTASAKENNILLPNTPKIIV